MKIGVLASVGGTIDAFFPPLIRRWEELGHRVVTAASSPSEFPSHSCISSLTRDPSLRNVCAPKDIAEWAREQNIDVLITNTATASFLARVWPMPVPVIYFCHGLHWNKAEGLSNRFWQMLELAALRRTDSVIVINSDDELWFERKMGSKSVFRLPAGVGVPIEEFRRSAIPAVSLRTELVWAGEFSTRKRPWLAVEVIHALHSMGISVHLTMCGDGPLLEKTREQVSDLGISHLVSLIGRTSEVPDFLSRSHALLMTSSWEGLPRIGLEALAIGRPVFAFDVKGTRSLPGVLLAPDGLVDDLAQLIHGYSVSGFSDIELTDPMVLHPNHAADEIVDVASRLLDESVR